VPARLGVDEQAGRQGPHDESLVVDLDGGPVAAVVDARPLASLEADYRQCAPEELATIEAIARDMGEPSILATPAGVPDAGAKIVFDRSHATRYVTEAVAKGRRHEHQALQAQDDLRLKGTKPRWLGNEETIPEGRRAEFETVKHAEPKTSRAWAITESRRGFWDYGYPQRAANYVKAWYFWATPSPGAHARRR
jgi:transposase